VLSDARQLTHYIEARNDPSVNIPLALVVFRKFYQLQQTQVAGIADIHINTYRRIEHGKSELVSVSKIREIAKAYGITASLLLSVAELPDEAAMRQRVNQIYDRQRVKRNAA
jgi:transcriptional regulator with XRE-family HTH domain